MRKVLIGVAGAILAAGMAACGGSTKTVTVTGSTATTATTSSGTKTATSSNDCDAMGINSRQLREGTCVKKGTTYTVVNENSTLRLESLTAKLDGISTADSVSAELGNAKATGRYVIVKLTVTNQTHLQARFGPVMGERQVGLALDDNAYSEDFEAENGKHEQSCVSTVGGVGGKAIQAGLSATCDVIFDVPVNLVPNLNKDGLILITNFDVDVSSSTGPVGVIRTYH